MKVFCIFGSPRPAGFSAQLLSAFTAVLPAGTQVETLDLYAHGVEPCLACGYCQKNDGCVFDDLDDADASLRTADLLVWALPVYHYSVPAPAKAFLDRMQRYYEAAFVRGEKPFMNTARPCVLLLSAGRSGTESLPIVEKQLRGASHLVGFSLQKTVFANLTDTRGLSPEFLAAAAEAAAQYGDA